MQIDDIKLRGEVLHDFPDSSAEWIETDIRVDIKGSFRPAVELRFFDGSEYQALRISNAELLELFELVKARTR
ncbi:MULTISPECIES: hypothetical protein [Nocardia]|uniref:hypothetical protein n=1 Tax=Nocardia TaxID=1817 RepID=UPI000D685503|nr:MULTISPECIES: hypothetical protein [Nocardia]